MRKVLAVLILASACGGDDSGGSLRDAGMFEQPDAPEFGPMITSFVATPSQLQSGVATDVTWTWTYASEPTIPTPTCSINQGIGPVTKGQAIPVTINAVTTFTLTCESRAGMASRQVVIGVPPIAPTIGSFTVTPAAITPNSATNLTFAWTYSNTPTPAPTCTVDAGIGTVTNGGAQSVTLPQARTFRLRCSNGQGASTYDATVAVNECGTSAAQCGANASCTETPNGYTCACNNGYTGDGNTCSLQAACGTTPALCDTNATCIGGSQCACKAGYIGSGGSGDCARARIAFTTSASGTGNLSTWTAAGGMAGLAAADNVCSTLATAQSLPGTYVAWMSDSTTDAYCRIHGLTGKRSNNCGQGALPVAAGPWVRTGDSKPFAPTIDKLTSRTVYYPAHFTETGSELTTVTDRVWSGTDETGAYSANACTDWTATSLRGTVGFVGGGGSSWTKAYSTTLDPTCGNSYRLRCMERDTGPALPPRHATNVKKAFVTSVSGTGNLSTWADAGGLTGMAAADEVCRARARYAGYANASTFKAWFTYTTSITSRIFTSALPYVRPDGVVLATTRSDMLDNKLATAWAMTESNQYMTGNYDTGNVWTGLYYYGSYSGYYCSAWATASTGSYGTFGRFDLLDGTAINFSQGTCDQAARLYCVEDQ